MTQNQGRHVQKLIRKISKSCAKSTTFKNRCQTLPWFPRKSVQKSKTEVSENELVKQNRQGA